ncbi:hypothetical protein DFJ74DRAFT_713435 [Hyaloraphidium curvatum]|nr:hypothetical protein DFJ74DRAFT_713435 [Hyaloraphidium curvatum]
MSKAAEAKAAEAAAATGGQPVQYRAIQEPLQVQEPDYSKGGWLVKTARGNPNRLILNFESDVWCGESKGLYDKSLPAELASKRITITTGLICGILLLPLPWVCASEGSYHKKLGMWLQTLNEEVLEPKGCYAKLQTNNETIQTGPNQTYSESVSWMAIALTPQESEALRQEPIFWTPQCCSDRMEADCCMSGACCCGTPCVV